MHMTEWHVYARFYFHIISYRIWYKSVSKPSEFNWKTFRERAHIFFSSSFYLFACLQWVKWKYCKIIQKSKVSQNIIPWIFSVQTFFLICLKPSNSNYELLKPKIKISLVFPKSLMTNKSIVLHIICAKS